MNDTNSSLLRSQLVRGVGLFILTLSISMVSGQPSSGNEVRVIVKFIEPALLQYWRNRLPAEERLQLNGHSLRAALLDRDILSYRGELEEIQTRRLQRLRAAIPGVREDHRYLHVFNGLAVTLDAEMLDILARQPGVAGVFSSARLEPEDSYVDEVIETNAAWTRLASVYGKDRPGEGIRVAILDSGILSEHPSFDDSGFSAPEGFPLSEFVRGSVRVPLSSVSTNNKVIVNNLYASPAASSPSSITSTHGSRVAAAAAGVPVLIGVQGGDAVAQGVAPYAYLLGFRVRGDAPEFLAAIEDVARYGADVLNISQGTTVWLGWAEGRNPIQEALEALAESGVVICFSAGNAGSRGSGTITGTFKYSDQLLTVGNHTSGRPLAIGTVSAVAPDEANNAANLQNLQLESSFPFVSPVRAPLQVTAMVQDSQGHLEDSHARKALHPFPSGSLSGKIALAERGSVDGLSARFSTKWANVKAGGAIALIVYNNAFPEDPGYRSFGLFLTADPYAVIERTPGLALDQAARKYGSDFEIEIAESTIFAQPDNLLANSSSRGPTPRLRIKPDLSAPGSYILLPSFLGADLVPNGFALTSGTSFSSPAVAGAAALLRQAHPEWSARQIRAALVTSAERQMVASGAPARIMVQGAGSLRVDRALGASLDVSPYTLSLRQLQAGESRNITIQIEDTRPKGSLTEQEKVYQFDVEPRTDGPVIFVQTPSLSLVGGQKGYVEVTVSAVNSAPGDYDGHILLMAPDGTTQTVPYFVRVPAPPLADVLLVLWLDDGENTNYRSRYESMLTEVGLSYEVKEMYAGDGMPTLEELQQYRMVLLATGDIEESFISSLRGGSFPWQSFLNAGGRLLVTGHGYPSRVVFSSSTQNQGADFLLSSYAAGFFPLLFNPVDDSAQDVRIQLTGLIGSVDVSSGSGGDGAENQKGIDLGRPVSASDLSFIENANELAPHVQELLSVSEITVDGMPLSVSSFNDTVATGVWPEATLERPTAGVSWGAVFLSFGLEGVRSDTGQLSGTDVLRYLYRWLVDDLRVRLELRDLVPGRSATLQAIPVSSLQNNDPIRFRWDFGDGSPIVTSTSPTITHTYERWPLAAPRVEVADAVGHTTVSPTSIYLPFLTTDEHWMADIVVHNVGSLAAVPEFLAFDDAGQEIARRRDRAILPGGSLSAGLAELFPAVSTGLVRQVRIDSAGNLHALAILTSSDREEMTTIPGQRWAQNQVYVPHISQAVGQYYTRYALIRTVAGSEMVQFEAHGETLPLNMPGTANSQDRRDFSDLYGGFLPPGLEWGIFTNSADNAILAGIEMFGRVDGARQVAAMPLDGNSANEISFVHISSDSDLFWTGMVYANVGEAVAEITLRSYASDGSPRATGTHNLAPDAKQTLLFDRQRTTTEPSIAFTFTEDVAWLQVQSSHALIGYEIFGTVDDSRIEGLTAAYGGATRLLFPYLRIGWGEWTGIAVVNLSGTPARATIKAVDPAGRVLAEVTRNYGPFAKDLGLAQQLFGDELPAGTSHLILESDSPLWGFELFGDDAGRTMAGTNAIPIE